MPARVLEMYYVSTRCTEHAYQYKYTAAVTTEKLVQMAQTGRAGDS